ncbi:MAG: hypothetical protein KDC32_08000, partial [Saprospiraceae bacterium]|nr:hypothetical protein [Saprospiraceae bacterium]
AIDASGSVAPPNATFQWSTTDGNILNGQGTPTISVDAAGAYVLLLSNLTNGCSSQASLVVTADQEFPMIDILPAETITCSVPSILLDASGSDSGPDFAFQWTTADGNLLSGADSPTPEVDAAGWYLLGITDLQNGCTTLDSVAVTADQALPVIDLSAPETLNCALTEIQLSASTGVGNPSVSWLTTDGHIVAGAQSLTPTVDAGGTYVIQLTDPANGCMAEDSLSVLQNTESPQALIDAPEELSCFLSSVQLEAGSSSSASGQLNFFWTTTDGNILSGDNTASPLVGAGGTYLLTITDPANACVATAEVEVLQDQNVPTAEAGPAAILGCVPDQLLLAGSGITSSGAIGFLWTTTDGSILSGANTPTPLVDAPGSYLLTITDPDNGCQATDVVLITEDLTLPVVDAGPVAELTCTATEVQLSGMIQGVPSAYLYEWQTADGNIVAGADGLQPLVDAAGSYTLVATDPLNGCSASATTTVVQDSQVPQAEIGPTGTLTCDQSTLILDASNSSQGANYGLSWTTTGGSILSGQNTLTPEVNAAGLYTLTITDLSNNCLNTASINVPIDTLPPQIVLSSPDTLSCDQPTIVLQGMATDTANLSISWSTVDGHFVGGVGGLQPEVDQAGFYLLSIVDESNGCLTETGVSVVQDTLSPQVSILPAATITCTSPTISLEGLVVGGPTLSFNWSTTDGSILSGGDSLVPTIAAGGTYSLLVVDADNGCTGAAQVAVPVDTLAPLADAGPDAQLDCGTPEIELDGSGSSQGIGLSYLWISPDGNISAGATTDSPAVDAPGTYVLQVEDLVNGCVAVDTVQVGAAVDLPVVSIEAPEELNCIVTETTLQASASTTSGQIELLWTTPDGNIVSGNSTLTPLVGAPGQYLLEVLDPLSGCVASQTVDVQQNV